MIYRIPDGLGWTHAAAANCLIGCTYSSLRDLAIGPEDCALVAGVGFIGHATIVNLKYRGAKVIVLGRTQSRMEIAERVGADHIVNPDDDDWLEQIRALTPDRRGADVAFECSGYPYYQQRCLDAIRYYGTLVLLGTPPTKVPICTGRSTPSRDCHGATRRSPLTSMSTTAIGPISLRYSETLGSKRRSTRW